LRRRGALNILVVTSSYPKFPGDVTSPFIESICEALAERGHTLDVVLPHHPELRRPAGRVRFFPYHYAPVDAWSAWGYAQSLDSDVSVRPIVYALLPLVALALRGELSRRLTAARYDVVHAHWVVPNAALAFGIVRAHGVPLVVSLHGSDVFLAERLAPARWLARQALGAAGAVSACSSDQRRRALALGAAPASLRTVPYGVDASEFAPSAASAPLRERYGIAADALLVLGVGRLVEKKGFRILVEAAARAHGVHLLLAGEGDQRDELVALARGLGAAITFAGALDRQAVRDAYAAADVVAVPSVIDRAGNVDGLPNTLLEALASGRAVVASAVAGIPDVVVHGENGVLVAPGDVSELALALERLAREPETRRRLGEAARIRAARELTWQRAAQSFEELFAQASALEAR
jgi:glycosyltransferase involved in cell wall biosynthesis